MNALSGKYALVTGGGRGIGAAIAMRLAAEGAAVTLTYRRSAEAAQQVVANIAAAGGSATAVALDVADEPAVVAAVRAAHDARGRLDIVVNNAGMAHRQPLQETTSAEFDALVATNLRAPYIVTREAARLMPPGSRVVMIGSTFGARVPVPGIGLYAMTKFALAGLTRGFARDLARLGITVNAVQPGPIDTEMNPAATREGRLLAMMTALGRHGAPEDVAAMVAFLASGEASYITGAVLNVDGGFEA